MLIGSEVYSIVTYLLSENHLDGNTDYCMRSSHKTISDWPIKTCSSHANNFANQKKNVSTLILFWQVICVHTNLIRPETVKKKSLSRYKVTKPHYDDILSNRMKLLWSILKVIFKTDLSYLLSLVFVSLSLVFVHVLFSCFDLLFLLVLELMLSSRIYLLPY